MKLQIFDTEGTELFINDLVKIQSKRNGTLTFYAKVEIINGQLYPFNMFSYDRILKVAEVPQDCKYVEAKNGLTAYWMNPRIELKEIEEGRRDAWRMNVLTFENNKFYKVSI